MRPLYQARYAIDFVAAAIDAAFGVVEHGVFVEDFIDRCASTRGVNLTEHVVQIAKQQGRYGVGHGSPRLNRVRLPSLHSFVRSFAEDGVKIASRKVDMLYDIVSENEKSPGRVPRTSKSLR
jgi:hypothetical protein